MVETRDATGKETSGEQPAPNPLGQATVPTKPPSAGEETATAVRAVLLDAKTIQLSTASRLKLKDASSEFLALVEDMAGSKTGLGLRSAGGVLFEISLIIKDSPNRGDISVKCYRPVIAGGPSLPEPFDNLSICLDIDARATQIDLDDEEECTGDYAEWKCYEALAHNPNLKGRIVKSNMNVGAYTWRDKRVDICVYIVQRLFFRVNTDGFNTYNTKRFNPATVTTAELDFELAKLYKVSPLPEEIPPPEETPPAEPRKCEVGTEPISEIATNSLNRPKFVKGKHGTIAYGTDKGVGYKDWNEDAVVIDSENGFAVIDGMGGMGYGEETSGVLAIELQSGLKRGKPFCTIHERAHKRMSAERLGNGGACYIGVRIKYSRLNMGQAGDVKLMVIGADSTIKFETRNQGSGAMIWNAVMVNKHANGKTRLSDTPLAVGDRIVTGTDGLFDNIPPMEVVTLIHGKTIQEAIQILNMTAKGRMRVFKECHDQKLPTPPNTKLDNMAIVIYDIENLD